MAITTEQVQAALRAASEYCQRQQYGWYSNDAAMREALEAAERVAPVAAPSPPSNATLLEHVDAADMTVDDVKCAVRLYRSGKRPIAAPKAFDPMADEFVGRTIRHVQRDAERCGYDAAPTVPLVVVATLEAVSAELGKQQAQEQPAREWDESDYDVAHTAAWTQENHERGCPKEPERGANPFVLDAVEHEALHAQIEQNGPYTRVGMVARALLRATKTLAHAERVAKAFVMSDDARSAVRMFYHGGSCGVHEVKELVEDLARAERNLGPTEREKELEAALKLSHEATEAAVTEWNAKEAELAHAKETIASLQLANEQQCNQCLSEMLTARDSELAELRAKLKGAQEVYRIRGNECEEQHRVIVQLRAKLAERERAMEPLSVLDRSVVDRWAGKQPHQHSQAECDACWLAGLLDKRFPKPAPRSETPDQASAHLAMEQAVYETCTSIFEAELSSRGFGDFGADVHGYEEERDEALATAVDAATSRLLLTYEERQAVKHLISIAHGTGAFPAVARSIEVCRQMYARLSARSVKPAPVDPVQQVIEEMRTNERLHPLEQASLAVWADRLEQALAQKGAP